MTGLSFQINDTMSIEGGYRLWNSTDPEFDNNDYDSPLIHTVEAGLTFGF
jgi:opacity protein-like surface antigen